MKSLSLSRPLVIMMIGVPGAGKSFFARQFSEMFRAPLVSVDRVRYELFSEPQYSKDEESIVERITLLQIEELLKTSKTILIDGGMSTRVARSSIERLAKKNGYGSLVIWVQTDLQTSRQRSLRRSSRRVFDEFNTSLTPELYEKLSKRLSPPSSREQHIVISGKHTYATQAKIVLKKLVSPREEAPVVDQPNIPQRPSQTPPPTRRSVTIQ